MWGQVCSPLHSDQLVGTCQRQKALAPRAPHETHPAHPCSIPTPRLFSIPATSPWGFAFPPGEFCNAMGSSSAPAMMKQARRGQGQMLKAQFLLAAGVVPTAAAAQPTSPKGFSQSEKGTAQIRSPGLLVGEMRQGARGGVRTSAADRLPLLVNQDQDEGQAEDAHDAGARRQCSSRDICKI